MKTLVCDWVPVSVVMLTTHLYWCFDIEDSKGPIDDSLTYVYSILSTGITSDPSTKTKKSTTLNKV